MTFLERVRVAETGMIGREDNALFRRSASSGSLLPSPGELSGEFSVEALRCDVQEHLPFENIASIMAENPERARSELRLACKRAFADERWSNCPPEKRRKLTEELLALVFGMGPLEELLADETVTEIMVNGARSIYFERNGKLIRSERTFDDDGQVRVLIDRIIEPLGRRLDESSPMVNARLPQGHRVNAIIPPLSPDGPMLTIRAFTRHVMTLEEMQRNGSFDESVRLMLGWLVLARKNLVVSGGTGSGKTTLLNALSCRISHGERIITIEDSLELKFKEHPHVVRLEARPRNAEGLGEVTIRELVVNALRMRPDRIIVGECRSGEAIDMLQAMNTGHDGSLTTLHANSPYDVIERMVTMVRFAMDLPVDAIEMQIGSAFDYIVQVARANDGSRFLSEIAECAFDGERRRCRTTTLYKRSHPQDRGKWFAQPDFLDELVEAGLADPQEVTAWRQRTC